MPVCAECGYATWEATTCPQCANPYGADQLRRDRREASTVSPLMVGLLLLFAVAYLLLVAFLLGPV